MEFKQSHRGTGYFPLEKMSFGKNLISEDMKHLGPDLTVLVL
jgi:hypothetical protein